MTTGCNSPHSVRCEFADAAAERAVKKTFAILGVDVEKVEQVRDFQSSLRFSEGLRKMVFYGSMIVIGIAAGALVTALWAGIKVSLIANGMHG